MTWDGASVRAALIAAGATNDLRQLDAMAAAGVDPATVFVKHASGALDS